MNFFYNMKQFVKKKNKKRKDYCSCGVSSGRAASHNERTTRMIAAGAIKIAKYCVMLVNNGAKSWKLPKIHVVCETAIAKPIKIIDAIKNVGIFSWVTAPRAKNDSIPTRKPRTATMIPRGASKSLRFAFNASPAPKTSPMIRAAHNPMRKSQLPTFFTIFSIFSTFLIYCCCSVVVR